MKMTLRKSNCIDDWYVIEKAEHDGKEWRERTSGNSSSFRSTARISDAEVEGTSAEMLAIADAIMGETACSFKRCAVTCRDGYAYLWSPRNSQHPGKVSMEDGRDLAEQIYKVIGAKTDEHD